MWTIDVKKNKAYFNSLAKKQNNLAHDHTDIFFLGCLFLQWKPIFAPKHNNNYIEPSKVDAYPVC